MSEVQALIAGCGALGVVALISAVAASLARRESQAVRATLLATIAERDEERRQREIWNRRAGERAAECEQVKAKLADVRSKLAPALARVVELEDVLAVAREDVAAALERVEKLESAGATLVAVAEDLLPVLVELVAEVRPLTGAKAVLSRRRAARIRSLLIKVDALSGEAEGEAA